MNLKPSDEMLGAAAEASVVALACAGDQPAFDELVRRHQSSIRNLLRFLCRNTTLADDLAQETFLQAWKQLRSLRMPDAFVGWVRKLAINSWRQHLRREKVFAELRDTDVGHFVRTSAAIQRLDLNSALAALAPDVRLCIVLSYHEGMSHSEIAAATQLPLGTVKSHVARGSARLRERLAAYDSSQEK